MPTLEKVSYKTLFCIVCTVLLSLAVYCYQRDQQVMNSNYKSLDNKMDKVIAIVSGNMKSTDVELGKLEGDIKEIEIQQKEHEVEIKHLKEKL